ncbi:hypothetical protein KW787_02245 [Candidatus Pacearchaeota archaeon]|nr:hypothetical protein [Candidatus Pacearchaeota archaeon]
MIGFDLDEIVFEFIDGLIPFIKEKEGIHISKKDFHSYNLYEVYNISKEKTDSLVFEFYESEEFDKILPVEGAVQAIPLLCSSYKIPFITSRPVKIKEKTISHLNKYFPSHPFELHHSGDYFAGSLLTSKAEICMSCGIDTIIEDNGSYALNCAREGINVVLFTKPWNKGVEHPLIKRVDSWSEAYRYLNPLANA